MHQNVPLNDTLSSASFRLKVTFAVSIGNTIHHATIPQDAPDSAYVNGPGIRVPVSKYFVLSYAEK